ncbi:MAG TPA: DMT family transporter [Gaiellaceae bacterium]|nr:DMT family transporter [Gaiellaceae bacterium]
MADRGDQHDAHAARRRGQLFVVLAAVAWSTAGVVQRELSVDTATQLAGRALFAALALAVFVAFLSRADPLAAFRAVGVAGLAVAVTTATASGMFIVALNHAKVANVLFMQAASPVAAALLAWLAFRESITRRTALAMAVALAGVALMVGGPGSGGLLGVSASLVMMLAFAISIVIVRHRREVSMLPAICLSQFLVVAIAAPFSHPGPGTGRDLLLLALLGVGQMGLGLTFVTMGARLLPAAEVALITLLEVVLGPLWVWISISEQPAATAIAGGCVVILAVLLQATEKTRAPATPAPSTVPGRAR